MSTLSARFNQATDLFISGLNDVIDPVDVIDNRRVGDDRGCVAVLVDDACLRDAPRVGGWEA